MVAHGDLVTVRYRIEATHSRDLFGAPRHRPPDPLGTGRHLPHLGGQDRQRLTSGNLASIIRGDGGPP
jgi:hypothetical protein